MSTHYTTVSNDARDRLHARFLSCLPKALADDLISQHTTVIYPKDSLLFSRGSPADLIFWVISGVVKLSCPIPGGDRIVVRLCGRGELLGFADFVDHDGHRCQAFEAHALSKCVVALLTREHVRSALEKLDSATLLNLMERLNTGWSWAAYRLARFLGSSFRQRMDLTLEDLSTRFGIEDKRGTLLGLKLSHADLAEMVGGSRPMVTRLVGDMVKAHSLYRSRKQYIVPASPRRDSASNGGSATDKLPVTNERVAPVANIGSDGNGNGRGAGLERPT